MRRSWCSAKSKIQNIRPDVSMYSPSIYCVTHRHVTYRKQRRQQPLLRFVVFCHARSLCQQMQSHCGDGRSLNCFALGCRQVQPAVVPKYVTGVLQNKIDLGVPFFANTAQHGIISGCAVARAQHWGQHNRFAQQLFRGWLRAAQHSILDAHNVSQQAFVFGGRIFVYYRKRHIFGYFSLIGLQAYIRAICIIVFAFPQTPYY